MVACSSKAKAYAHFTDFHVDIHCLSKPPADILLAQIEDLIDLGCDALRMKLS